MLSKRLFVLLMTLGVWLKAQEKSKIIEIHLYPVEDRYVDFDHLILINKNTEKIAQNIGENLWSVEVRRGDEVVIVGENISRKSFEIGEVTFTKGYISLPIYTESYLLGEANLNLGLTGNLKDDLKRNPVKKYKIDISQYMLQKQLNDYQLNTNDMALQHAERNMPSMGPGASAFGVGIPFGPGTTKESALFNDLRQKEHLKSRIVGFFGYEMFLQDLRIPKENIYAMVNFAIFEYQADLLFRDGRYLELVDIFRYLAPRFRT